MIVILHGEHNAHKGGACDEDDGVQLFGGLDFVCHDPQNHGQNQRNDRVCFSVYTHKKSSLLSRTDAAFEKQHIENVLRKNDSDITLTAERLNITKRQLWNKIADYHIDYKK